MRIYKIIFKKRSNIYQSKILITANEMKINKKILFKNKFKVTKRLNLFTYKKTNHLIMNFKKLKVKIFKTNKLSKMKK